MKHSILKTLTALAVLVLTALPLSAAEVVTYYHNDHLGSPIAATDDTGAVVWQQAYGPWGLKLTANTDERGYTGNWLDEETGLADHKARWYTSSIGRFTGIDPVEWQESNIHSFNRYAYASNNPYAYVDRDGRNAVTAFGGLIVESYNFATGKGFDGSMVLGALADGYDGEGAGFARSLYQDAESFVPIGAVAGALIKSGRLAKGFVTNSGRSVGAMARREYQAASYHGKVGNAVKSKAPTNGQDALDMSVQVKGTSPRRVGIDYKTGEFTVFDQTSSGVFHGHVRGWKDLTSQMQNTLRNAGMVDRKGNILGGGQ